MPGSLKRVFSMSFFLSVLFISVFSGNVFASPRSTHSTKAVAHFATSYYIINCSLDKNVEHYVSGLSYSSSGNNSGCNASFEYEPLPNTNQVTGYWTVNSLPNDVNSCNVDAWFPYGDLSSDTRAHYDFWGKNGWLGWVGYDINQYSAPAGWNRIATNLTVGYNSEILSVTVHDNGGSGNLAFAAMSFLCTEVAIV